MKVKYKSEKLCFIASLRKPLPNPVQKVKSKWNKIKIKSDSEKWKGGG